MQKLNDTTSVTAVCARTAVTLYLFFARLLRQDMADYWKSNERKYCDFCKCWLSDNKASISFHENGKRHKANVAKRLCEISRNKEKAKREQQKQDADIRKMENAAMRAYAQDIHTRGDLTARNINTVMAATNVMAKNTAAAGNSKRQIDPMRLEGWSDDDDDDDNKRVTVGKVQPEKVPDASLWVEGKSNEGYTYYWNIKTNESVWEEPKEGYLSYEEYQRINALVEKQQEIKFAEEAKQFRDNVDEEVARYNRERFKILCNTDAVQQEQKQKEQQRQIYKTELEAESNTIGQWQVVEAKPPPAPIDWQLPKINNQYIAPVLTEAPNEPPVKRFKEKTVETLDAETRSSAPATFKKRKFASKGNTRKPLDE